MDALLDSSALAIARAIRSRAVSSHEVTLAFLERIRERNPAINAAVQIADERALAEAAKVDEAIARGEPDRPFLGVPFTVKDVFDTEGIVTAAGLTERRDFVPVRDAIAVARMRSAGAVLIAKSNCPTGGSGGDTDNPVYGRTNNPYDLARTPGGSSGGEAALLGAGCSPLGLGSDSGGSIRLPAHYCGVAALKPTAGRVPNTGAYDHPGGLSDVRTQIGPMSRHSDDLYPALKVIAGPDWHDSGVIDMPLLAPKDVSIAGLRIAFFEDDGLSRPTKETRETVEESARLLEASGAIVERAQPDLADVWPITKAFWNLDDSSGGEATKLYERWDRFRSRMLGFLRNYDAILCPVDRHPAPLHDADDPERFSYTLVFSLTGWPSAVVRAGISPLNLPIGVQIVARPWREDVALAVALYLEESGGGWRPPSVS